MHPIPQDHVHPIRLLQYIAVMSYDHACETDLTPQKHICTHAWGYQKSI